MLIEGRTLSIRQESVGKKPTAEVLEAMSDWNYKMQIEKTDSFLYWLLLFVMPLTVPSSDTQCSVNHTVLSCGNTSTPTDSDTIWLFIIF